MSVQLPDRYNDPMMPAMPQNLAAPGDELDGTPFSAPFPTSFPPVGSGFDSISRFFNPQQSPFGTDASFGTGMTSLLQQLLSTVTQLLAGFTGTNGNGNQQFFSSASGGSNGDPHLSFNGNTWNDMASESDLLDSDSLPGGYRLSTQTTPPDANGITYNQQATVTTGYGSTQVTLDKNGNATYTQYGVANTIALGQSVSLGNGETVSRSQNGTLTIVNAAPSGGQITTTMTENGNGVNVDVTATNVDLGGTLVTGSNTSSNTGTRPVYRRY